MEVQPQAALFPCRSCGIAYEPTDKGLEPVRPFTCAISTRLAYPPQVRYLAIWRFLARVEVRSKESRSQGPPGQVWEAVRRAAAPGEPHVFVPAFAYGRLVVQQLGARLVETQPRLRLEAGIPPEVPQLTVVGDRSRVEEAEGPGDPGFGTVSPVVLSSSDARIVAHYVYLALENRRTLDLRRIDYELEVGDGDLLYLPAVYDRRYVRDSGWRLLLEEFDGLVA